MPPRWLRAASRRSTTSPPSLLKPMRLITASSRSSRNSRGRGLPVCGFGVTVPISTKPKPSRSSASGASAFLSKPAAMPTGLGKFSPKARTARLGASGGGGACGSSRSPWIARRCASSGSSQRSSGSDKASKARITTPAPECRASRRRGSRSSMHRGDGAEVEVAIEMRKQFARRASAPSAARRRARRSRPRSGTGRCGRRSACAAVPSTWAAVEKWMKPSRRSSALPRKTPCRSASRQAEASQIL